MIFTVSFILTFPALSNVNNYYFHRKTRRCNLTLTHVGKVSVILEWEKFPCNTNVT